MSFWVSFLVGRPDHCMFSMSVSMCVRSAFFSCPVASLKWLVACSLF